MAAIWRWTKRLLVTAGVLALAGAITLWMVLREYEKQLPSTKELKDYRPPQVTRVLARDGTLLAELFVQRRTVVRIGQISKAMKVAVLAAEDADFYRHEGLDYLGMLRALVVNLRSAKMRQGGSTITQQVVKNVLLGPERTFERKAREVLLAWRIEQELTKDEILELYLNHIYFGHGRYGVEEAARYYFGKSIDDVTLAEAALIAALPKGPSIYSPRVDVERAHARRDAILDQVGAKGFASVDAVEQAKTQPIALAPAVESLPELAPEAVSEVRRTLRQLVGAKAVRGGFVVTTTIDPKLQAAARKAVRNNLDNYAKRHHLVPPLKKSNEQRKPFRGTPSAKGHHVYVAVVTGADDDKRHLRVRVGTKDGIVRLEGTGRYNPKKLPPSRFAEPGALVRLSPVLERGIGADGLPSEFRLELGPQSALVAIDPKRREIRAMVGSYEGIRGGLDRSSRARRQPGSTFKPFVYSYGIHSRQMTPATIVPIEQPARGDGEQPPPLRLRDAIAFSVNAAASWALEELGAENVVSWAQALGVESKLEPTDSLALGAYEVTPRELAGAYTALAAAGTFEKPILIARIVDPEGAEIELPTQPPRRRVMAAAEAYVVTNLLTSVVQYGTGRRARKLGLPLAGKTGTSNKAKDAWFAGYSPELVAVVWTGFDDAVSLGKREQGATAALPAWIAFMKAAHAARKPSDWKRPDGVTELVIDPRSGLLPYDEQEDTIAEIFVQGTEPTLSAEPPQPDDGAGGHADDGQAEHDDGAGGHAADERPLRPDDSVSEQDAGSPENPPQDEAANGDPSPDTRAEHGESGPPPALTAESPPF